MEAFHETHGSPSFPRPLILPLIASQLASSGDAVKPPASPSIPLKKNPVPPRTPQKKQTRKTTPPTKFPKKTVGLGAAA